MDDDDNQISELTRRDIFDALRLENVQWAGRLGETDFLSRVFDLTKLPSEDYRASNMLGDVSLHRENFHDWDDNWPYDDGRLNLLRAPDETFLRFICEMIHPIVRADDLEVDKLLALFNSTLAVDGYQLSVKSVRSGRRIFAASHTLLGVQATKQAREVADALESGHIADQITRMEASILSDPALAIGSAKEFLESLCKAILAERRLALTGHETLPKLVHQTRLSLSLEINPKTDDTLRSVLGGLGNHLARHCRTKRAIGHRPWLGTKGGAATGRGCPSCREHCDRAGRLLVGSPSNEDGALRVDWRCPESPPGGRHCYSLAAVGILPWSQSQCESRLQVAKCVFRLRVLTPFGVQHWL
jgi:hypothetical protein